MLSATQQALCLGLYLIYLSRKPVGKVSITLLILLEGNLKITQLLSAKRELGTSSLQPQSTARSTEKKRILAQVSLHTCTYFI